MKSYVIVICFFLCALNGLVSFAQTKEKPLQKVRLQLKWLHQFEFAGYYMAIEKGFYQQVGIETELVGPKIDKSPVDLVTEGDAEFGISASDIILSRAKNKKVVVLASIFQHSPNVLLTPINSGIRRGKDIDGRTIALEADSSEIIAFLKAENVTLNKSQVKPLIYEAKQLLNSEVDVISAYSTDEPYYLDSIGFNYTAISPRSSGIDFYGDVLFTTEQLIKSDPELVHRFRSASMQGWEYAMNHPFETIDIIYNKYSKRHSLDFLKFEMIQSRKLIMPELIEIGYSNPERWKMILHTYQQLNLVPKKQQIKGLLYSDYHKEITDINWKLIGIFAVILMAVASVAWFFYYTTRKLKAEMYRRKKAEVSLQNLNVTLEQRINERNAKLSQINADLTREIEERIKFETLLEQEKNNYETFFNSINDLIFVYDFRGNILHCNIEACSRLEYSEEELNGKPAIFIHPPNRAEETQLVINKIITEQENICTIPLYTKSGNQFPVETRVSKGIWNGQPVFFSINKDLSQIELSERKFASAFQSNTAMMAISKTENGKYIDVNQEFTEALEYSREEIIDKTNSELRLFIDPQLREAILVQLNQNIPVRKKEVQFYSRNGNIKTGLLSADIIYVGKDRCLLTVTMDITDRKEAEKQILKAREEAERANTAKSEFLSRMSHELRTPLNAILGFAQLLEMGELSAVQRNGLNHILKSGRHLLDLINEVLDISRIEAGRLTLSIEPVEINQAFREMTDIIRTKMQEKQISLILKTGSLPMCFVQADRQRLKQILLNLLDNACKYNKTGGSITIETTRLTDPGSGKTRIRLAVSDTGFGISKENVPRLFIPFERIGADNTNIEGTGLGLSVVRRLVEALNGNYGVESTVGEGSTFWVVFDECDSQVDLAKKAYKLSDQETKLAGKGGIILYIEDNFSNIELIEQIIASQRSDIKLITDTNGSKAVHLAMEYQPGLIFLDLNLPDIHGSEVLKQLLENKETKNIPIVIISADAMPRQTERLLKLGAKKYLTKPLDVAQFLTTVDEYLLPLSQKKEIRR